MNPALSRLTILGLTTQGCFFEPTGSVFLEAGTSSASETDAALPGCGDGVCSLDEFQGGTPSCLEDCEVCLSDGDTPCYFEGDGICDAKKGEDLAVSGDCAAVCGDSMVGEG